MPAKSTTLNQNKFIYTSELTPPKGIDLSKLINTASDLNMIDAFNITDNHNSKMTMAPIGLARKLIEHNIEPIYQITCRDRNSMAIQSDLLAAYSLGINNILCFYSSLSYVTKSIHLMRVYSQEFLLRKR